MAAFSLRQGLLGTFSILYLASSGVGLAEDAALVSLQATLEFQEAYEYVIENAMRVKDAEAAVGVRQAERLQESLYPNPELNISVDGPSGSYTWSNCQNDISIGLTQLFELGGKRRARIRVAEAAECETSWELEILKCDLRAALMHAFIDSAVAQERLILAEDLHRIAAQSFECISSKAACGKVSPLDSKKAEIALKTAKLTYHRRLAETQKKKIQIVSLWNASTADFEKVDFALFHITPPPLYNELASALEQNPELSRTHAELSKAWEIIEFERTRRIPNMAVYVGVSTERNFHDPALSFGLNIPLPIFDRNQGNVARATHEFNQVIFKQADMINQLRNRLKILYAEWSTAYQQAAELKEIVETTANEAFQLAEDRYALGNSDFLEFLDARTTLFNIRQQYLDAVEEYHHKRADILQLLAKCCQEVFTR